MVEERWLPAESDAGADDLDGTVVWYDITHVGGAGTHQETTAADLQHAAIEAGFDPVERDTLYRRVRRDGARWWLADAEEDAASMPAPGATG